MLNPAATRLAARTSLTRALRTGIRAQHMMIRLTSSSSSSRSTYPHPGHSANLEPVCPPAPLSKTYLPPPSPESGPTSLPFRPAAQHAPPPGWTVTQHILPAAYPRRFRETVGGLSRSSSPFSETGGAPPQGESKEERMKRNERELQFAVNLKRNARPWADALGEGEADEAAKGLWIAADRWTRDKADQSGQEGITLVVKHANGFSKECWIPTISRLLSSGPLDPSSTFGEHRASASHISVPRTAPHIDEIWLLDEVNHGASVDLNAGRLGPIFSWSDGGRDVINFLDHVWPESKQPHGAPTQLPWSDVRGKKRKVVGVGHSFGGNALVQAAHARPDLFHGIFLVDPMCVALNMTKHDVKDPSRFPLVRAALRRRTSWPNLETAAGLRPTPFFKAWHPETWRLHLSHELVPVKGRTSDEQAVELATPSWCEASVFNTQTDIGEGWDKLPGVHVPVGFLMADEPTATMGEEMSREMVWRPPRAANERVAKSSHMVVQEKPDEVADALWRFLGGLSREMAASTPQAKL